MKPKLTLWVWATCLVAIAGQVQEQKDGNFLVGNAFFVLSNLFPDANPSNLCNSTWVTVLSLKMW